MATLLRAYFNATAAIDVFDATHDVKRAMREAKAQNGLVTVYVPVATAGVTIVENDPEIRSGIKKLAASFVAAAKGERPQRRSGTGALEAHLRAALLARSVTIPIHEGRLMMGPWQEVIVIDFDNRVARTEVFIHVLVEPKPEAKK